MGGGECAFGGQGDSLKTLRIWRRQEVKTAGHRTALAANEKRMRNSGAEGPRESAKLEAGGAGGGVLWESIFYRKLRGGCFSRAQWRRRALAELDPQGEREGSGGVSRTDSVLCVHALSKPKWSSREDSN